MNCIQHFSPSVPTIGEGSLKHFPVNSTSAPTIQDIADSNDGDDDDFVDAETEQDSSEGIDDTLGELDDSADGDA